MKPITVVKFGGSLAKDEKLRSRFLGELAQLARKEPVVLVHGGGPEINAWLKRLNIENKFVNGLRYTDFPTLEIVEMVLSGKVNKAIVAELNSCGVKAVGISGKDGRTVLCKRLKNLGLVGQPLKTDPKLVRTLLAGGFLPVLSSLGFDASGQTLNVNADSLAMAAAVALKARRLILFTDVCGVLDAERKTLPVITLRTIPRLLKDGVITGGMIPKINACATSLKKGIREVWIADGAAGLKQLKGTLIRAR